MPDRKLEIRLTRSIIGLSPKQEATVKALGLRRMHQAVTQADTPTIRGMIAKVVHVLHVGDAPEGAATAPAERASKPSPRPMSAPAPAAAKTSAAKTSPTKARSGDAAGRTKQAGLR